MIRNYRDLTRLEMEQVNKDETIVLIPWARWSSTETRRLWVRTISSQRP